MGKIVEPQKEIDVFDDVDVIVVGGKPAGIEAALSSGRNGANTLLIERFGSLRGLQTQGNNSIFTFVDPEIHGGILLEILDRLKKAGALRNLEDVPIEVKGRMKSRIIPIFGAENLPKRFLETDVGYWGVCGFTFNLEYYKFLTETMMEEAGVKILYHTLAVDVIREGNIIKGIIIESNEGRHVVIGKCIIDCTGIGHIVWKSGAPCFGEKGYPIGLKNGLPGGMLNTFYIAGVNLEKFRKFKAENLDEWGEMYGGRKMIKKAKEKGAYIIGESVIIASLFDVYNIGRVYVMNPVHKTPPDKKSWMIEDITESEIDMRKQAWELFKHIKKKVPKFENSYLERTSNFPCIGIGHRIMGDHVLSIGDMRKGRIFEDSVAINNMPPDIYESVGRFKFDIIPHDIPYRC